MPPVENQAERQFDAFLGKYTPEISERAREILKQMRKRLPGAVELVYDNYNALVVGFSSTEKTSNAIFSIALYPRWVTLFFLNGAGLPDPEKRLKGNGKIVRHIVLPDAKALNDAAIRTLMNHALTNADPPFDPKGEHRMIVKSISLKQRPRRPALKLIKPRKGSVR